MKIIYIEDDLDDLERFCIAVKNISSDYECYAACDGLKGIEMIESINDPDFIFIDVNLPGLTGKEILMMLRRDVRFRLVPIILTSVLLSPSQVADLRAYGANHCMTKPEHVGDLTEKIRAIIWSHVGVGHGVEIFKQSLQNS